MIKDLARRAKTIFADSLANIVSGLGTERDKAAGVSYQLLLMSDEELLVFFRSSWVARKIVTIPAYDAVRAWRNWQAKKDQLERIENEEKRLGLQGKVYKALIMSRLMGGSAIYIGTGEADASQPLDPATIKAGGIRFLTVLPRRALSVGEIEQDPASEYFGYPKMYTFVGTDIQKDVHPSRLVLFRGEEVPDSFFGGYTTPDGWGDSVLLAPKKDITDAQGTAGNIASLIYEAKVDVIKIKDLMSHLEDPNYEALLLRRLALAARAKGINGALILDTEEEYEQKSASFQTLPQVLEAFFQIVAGAADIPLTRFMGASPGGLNSTGESDVRNYYDRIKADQEIKLTPALHMLDECLIYSALGSRPPEIHHTWTPLWQLGAKEAAEIGKLHMETIKVASDTNLYPPEALANAGITLMVESGTMPSLQEQVDDAGGLPDYEAELEAQKAAEAAALEAANSNQQARQAANDAAPKSLYVRRDVLNYAEIAAHYERQGLKVTKPEKFHITVIHSKAPVDWFSIGPSWDASLTLNPGGARDHAFFGPPGLEDSLVLMVKSNELEWRNEAFRTAGAIMTYPEYQPHVTLQYSEKPFGDPDLLKIEPWLGEIKLGPEIFEEVKTKEQLGEAD